MGWGCCCCCCVPPLTYIATAHSSSPLLLLLSTPPPPGRGRGGGRGKGFARRKPRESMSGGKDIGGLYREEEEGVVGWGCGGVKNVTRLFLGFCCCCCCCCCSYPTRDRGRRRHSTTRSWRVRSRPPVSSDCCSDN